MIWYSVYDFTVDWSHGILSCPQDSTNKSVKKCVLSCSMQVAKIQKYCVPAVQGFFKSIALSNATTLQDTLR